MTTQTASKPGRKSATEERDELRAHYAKQLTIDGPEALTACLAAGRLLGRDAAAVQLDRSLFQKTAERIARIKGTDEAKIRRAADAAKSALDNKDREIADALAVMNAEKSKLAAVHAAAAAVVEAFVADVGAVESARSNKLVAIALDLDGKAAKK